MRADAQRNRDAIIAAARDAFTSEGITAPIDGIAQRAGIGNATLYRNFPTRDCLVAAVMEDTVQSVIRDSAELDGIGPDDALREWMFRLTWQLRTWQDLPSCIADAVDDSASPVQSACERLIARTGELLGRSRDDGTASDVGPEQVFELLTTVSWGVDRFGDDAPAARRRVALATAGVLPTV